MSSDIYDVVIIGSGPAGDTAAIYCQRAGFKVVLVSGYEIGGQLTTTTTIENFPGFPGGIKGAELDKMMAQVKELNCPVINENVKNVDLNVYPYKVTLTNDQDCLTNNIIVATGAKAKYLGLPNEENFVGKGVSVCATCDGFFYKKKTVCVVGGGNTAAIEALHLAQYSAKVYIIYRQDSFKKMEKEMEERLKKNEKIEFIFNSEVVEYIGTKKIEKIKVLNNKTKEITEMKMDGVFMAIGKLPTSEIFKDSKLELDKLGYIVTQPDSTKTNMKGIYACGDVANKKIKQAIFAAGQGCLAAMELQADYKLH